MNTKHTPLILDGADVDSFDNLERWQTVGIVTLGATGLVLVLAGVGAMVIAVGHAVSRLIA